MSCKVACVFFFFKHETADEMLRSLVGSEMCIRDRPCEILATSLSMRSLITALYTAVLAFVTGILADHLGLGQALVILSLGLTVFSPLYMVSMEKRTFACEDASNLSSDLRRIQK